MSHCFLQMCSVSAASKNTSRAAIGVPIAQLLMDGRRLLAPVARNFPFRAHGFSSRANLQLNSFSRCDAGSWPLPLHHHFNPFQLLI